MSRPGNCPSCVRVIDVDSKCPFCGYPYDKTGRDTIVAAPIATSILAEAERITTQTRRDEYGHPFDNFSRIAREWSLELAEQLKVDITPEQVGRMMIRVKMVRLRHNPKHRDSLVDISGYANCLDLIRQRREEKP